LEFDLRSVQYEVKSSRCHEMRLAASPHDCLRFNFRCDREAEAWSTVVFLEYGFHPRVQRWVIGQCLCSDPRSLASYGVQKDGDTAYLYLISARQARVTRQLFQQDLDNSLMASPLTPGSSLTSQVWRGYSTLPSKLPHNNQGEYNKDLALLLTRWRQPTAKICLSVCVKPYSRLSSFQVFKSRTGCYFTFFNLFLTETGGGNNKAGDIKDVPDFEKLQQTEWACPSCTFINKPSRPGCEICATARPDVKSCIQQVLPDI
ncbi:hypothetical protein XENOCAPTIV_022822, partial [Xenoophorus captivus]